MHRERGHYMVWYCLEVLSISLSHKTLLFLLLLFITTWQPSYSYRDLVHCPDILNSMCYFSGTIRVNLTELLDTCNLSLSM